MTWNFQCHMNQESSLKIGTIRILEGFHTSISKKNYFFIFLNFRSVVQLFIETF
jgi:hypothetical protein